MPFTVLHGLKLGNVITALPISQIRASLVKLLSVRFNPKEYWGVNRTMKNFGVIQHYFGYVLIGVLFNNKDILTKSLFLPEPIECNGKKAQIIRFKFPRTTLVMHSFFKLPIVTNVMLRSFFNRINKYMSDTGYDLLMVDAPVGSDQDKVLRTTPAFLYLKTIKDRRKYYFLDGKQTTYSKLKTGMIGKVFFRDLIAKYGARVDYQKEIIQMNRYVTSLSMETILPKSTLKNLTVKEKAIDPDTIVLPENPRSKVLYIRPKEKEIKTNYGW
jgi:hypothetical protein